LVFRLVELWIPFQDEEHCFLCIDHQQTTGRMLHCGEVRSTLPLSRPCSPMNASFDAMEDHRESPASGVRLQVLGEHERNPIANLRLGL
jgi:hypothetical protein